MIPWRRARIGLPGAVIALVAIGLIVLWVWNQGAERRAISRLPPSDRANLYRHDLESLRALCGEGPRTDALDRECRERAEFIVQFPECDQSCQELAERLLQGRRR